MRKAFLAIALLTITFPRFQAEAAQRRPAEAPMSLAGTDLRPSAQRSTASTASLAFTVTEPTGVDRPQAVVRGGIPFPQGVLTSPSQVRVIADGKEIPSFTRQLAAWEDDSVRWLLLEFQDSFAAGQTRHYQLEYGAGVSQGTYATQLTVETDSPQSPGWITVDTGPLFVRLDKSAGALFTEIRYQGMVVVDGKQAWNGAFTSGSGGLSEMTLDGMEIEEQGPTSVTIKLSARPTGKDFFTDLRLTLHAGSGEIHLEHTTIVATKNTDKAPILQEIGIAISLAEAARTYELGMAGGETRTGSFDGALKRLEQPGWDRYTLEGSDFSGSLPGYAALTTDSVSLLIATQDWWQTFPKQIALDPSANGLTLYLWRGQSRTLYENVEDPAGPGAELSGNPRGVGKSGRILLSFGPQSRSSDLLQARVLAFDQPLLIQAPQGWNASSQALYFPVLPYQGTNSRMEAVLRLLLQSVMAAQRRFAFYGFWDYGDTKGEYGTCTSAEEQAGLCPDGWRSTGRYGWRNGNIDIQHPLLLAYFRTGDRTYFTHGEAMARHVRDVDTIHYHPDVPSEVGGTHRHNREHWGEDGFSAKYTNVDGLMLYYFLTGDLRTKEVLEREMGPFHLAESPRYWQMTLLKLLSFWTMTRDQRYWDAIQQVLEGNGRTWPGLKNMDPAQVADVESYGSNSYSGVLHRGALGLWQYWRITGDPYIPTLLEAIYQAAGTTSLTEDFSYASHWDTTYLGPLFDTTGDPEALNRLLHETLSEIDGLLEEGQVGTGQESPDQMSMAPDTWWHIMSPLDVSVHYRMLVFNLGTLTEHGATDEAHIDRLWAAYQEAVNAGDLALAANGASASTNDFYSDGFAPQRAIDGLISTDPDANLGARDWNGGNRWRSKSAPSVSAPVDFTVTFAQSNEVSTVQLDTLNYRQNSPSDFSLLCDGSAMLTVRDGYGAYRTLGLEPSRRCTAITLRTTASNQPNTFVALNEMRAFGPDYQPPDLRQLLLPGPSPTFADVPFDHPYYEDIEALYQAGYTAGCSTGPLMYCPDATMNRAESAVFVERGIHGTDTLPPAQPSTQTFADLPLDSWAAKWAEALWQDHYTAGCGTDPLIYCPWQGHTRAEGCVFYLHMLNGAAYEPPQPSQQTFADIPLEAWYAKWVQAGYDAGLITPCQTTPDLRFCPNDPLSRGLAAYMMVRAKNLPLQ